MKRYWTADEAFNNDYDAFSFTRENTLFTNSELYGSYIEGINFENYWSQAPEDDDFVTFVSCRRRRSSVRRRGVIRRRGLQLSGGACVTIQPDRLLQKVFDVVGPETAEALKSLGETDVAGMIAKAVETLKNHAEGKTYVSENLARLSVLSNAIGGEEGMKKLMNKLIGPGALGSGETFKTSLPGLKEKAAFEASYIGPGMLDNPKLKYGMLKLCVTVDLADGKFKALDAKVNYDATLNQFKTTVEGEGAHPGLMAMGALGMGLAKTITLTHNAMQIASKAADQLGFTNTYVKGQLAKNTAEMMGNAMGLGDSRDMNGQEKDKKVSMEKKFWSAVATKVAMDKGQIKAARDMGMAHSTSLSFKSWDTDKTFFTNAKDILGSFNLKTEQQMYNKLTVNGHELKNFKSLGINVAPGSGELNGGFSWGASLNGATQANKVSVGLFSGGYVGVMTSSYNSYGGYSDSQNHSFKSLSVDAYGGWNDRGGRIGQKQIEKHFGSRAEQKAYYTKMKQTFDSVASKTGDVGKAQAALNKAIKDHPATKAFNAKTTRQGRRSLLGGGGSPPPPPPPPPPSTRWQDYRVPAAPRGNTPVYWYGTNENPMNKQLVTRVLMDRQQRKQGLINVNTQDNTAIAAGTYADLWAASEDARNGGVIVGASAERKLWTRIFQTPHITKPTHTANSVKNFFLRKGDFNVPKSHTLRDFSVQSGEGTITRRRYLNCLKIERTPLDTTIDTTKWKTDDINQVTAGLEAKPQLPGLPSDTVYKCKKYDDSLPDAQGDYYTGFENGCLQPEAVPAENRRRSMLNSYTSEVKRSEGRSSRRSLQSTSATEQRRSLQGGTCNPSNVWSGNSGHGRIDGYQARLAPSYGGFPATNCLTAGGHNGGMCHSGMGEPWIDIFYRGPYTFSYVIVQNRESCCQGRFNQYTMSINHHVCDTGSSHGCGGYYKIPCSGLGSYLRLQYNRRDFLNLQYVGGVGKKLTYLSGISAKMSSQHGGWAASRCLTEDGEGCHTQGGPHWLEVTYPGSMQFTAAVIQNRSDCCQDRFREYTVSVDGTQCASDHAHSQPYYITTTCIGRGTTMRVTKPNPVLNLMYFGAVVDIPGDSGYTNQAGSCSTYSDFTGPSGQGRIDGYKAELGPGYGGFPATNCLTPGGHNGGMCHSGHGQAWIKIYYNKVVEFSSVVVQNRESCCRDRFRNYKVSVSDQECATGDSHGCAHWFKIPCNITGTTIKLQYTRSDHLNLQYVGGVGKKKDLLTASSAKMSSQHADWAASRCMSTGGNGCHTEGGGTHWIEMSYSGTQTFQYAVIENRADCCQDRLQTYFITVDGTLCSISDAKGAKYFISTKCLSSGSKLRLTKPNPVINFQYFGAVGSKQVQPKSTQSYSFEKPEYKILKANSAKLSSDHGAAAGSRCINDDNSLCHSGHEASPWLEMSYANGAFYYFTDVVVTNRADCCQHRFKKFEVYAQQSMCFKGNAEGYHGKRTFPCVGLGNKIKLQLLETDFLNIMYFAGKGVYAPVVDASEAKLSSKFKESWWHHDDYQNGERCLKKERRSLQGSRRRPPPPPPPPPPQPTVSAATPCVTSTSESSLDVDKWLEIKYDILFDFYGAVVQNRKDCCQDRFRQFELHMDGQLCVNGDGKGVHGYSTFLCEKISARTTRTAMTIKLTLLNVDYLNLRYLGGVGYPTMQVDGKWEGLGWGLTESTKQSAEETFDGECYAARYPDIKKTYGTNYVESKKHFLDHGIKEERNGACHFDCKCYIGRHSDLKAAFGKDCVKALKHWKENGIKEGRVGDCRFQCDCYLNKYADLIATFGNNCAAAMDHWIDTGMKEGRTAWCSYETPAMGKKSTPKQNGCVTSDSLKNLENDYVSKVVGSQQIESWKGQAAVFEDGVSTGDASAQCGYRGCSDPKYAWNTQMATIDGKDSCSYAQCAMGTNTYLAGGAITKKPDVSSGCSYYHTGQFPYDPQVCSELTLNSPEQMEDCRIDSFGSGGYMTDTCRCITSTFCPSGKTETACGNVGAWNNRDYYQGRKRSLQGSRRRPPPPPPPPPPKHLKEWVSAGSILNGNCCVYVRDMFNCTCYRNRYGDLKNAFGSNCGNATTGLEGHYRRHGIGEGRNAKC